MLKLNLGCGSNILPAPWENHDADVDITKPLPWTDGVADFILIEHCLEHVGTHEALAFLEECYRILKPGGVLRVIVPSLTKLRATLAADYAAFTERFLPGGTRRTALKAMVVCHGHRACYSPELLLALLDVAGFDRVESANLYHSRHDALNGTTGHHKVIGERFNTMESICAEATK